DSRGFIEMTMVLGRVVTRLGAMRDKRHHWDARADNVIAVAHSFREQPRFTWLVHPEDTRLRERAGVRHHYDCSPRSDSVVKGLHYAIYAVLKLAKAAQRCVD